MEMVCNPRECLSGGEDKESIWSAMRRTLCDFFNVKKTTASQPTQWWQTLLLDTKREKRERKEREKREKREKRENTWACVRECQKNALSLPLVVNLKDFLLREHNGPTESKNSGEKESTR